MERGIIGLLNDFEFVGGLLVGLRSRFGTLTPCRRPLVLFKPLFFHNFQKLFIFLILVKFDGLRLGMAEIQDLIIKGHIMNYSLVMIQSGIVKAHLVAAEARTGETPQLILIKYTHLSFRVGQRVLTRTLRMIGTVLFARTQSPVNF